MERKLKFGLIGLGGISQLVHIPILSSIKGIQLSVAEINKNKLNSISQKFNISNIYTDYNELIEKELPDAVIIATPTDTHKSIALQIMGKVKNILIEKPVALNYNEAYEIYSRAAELNTNVMVGMNYRFRSDSLMIKSKLSDGSLGDILYIKCRWFKQKSSNEKWFTYKERSGGGVLMDLGIVLIDMALWLMDFPEVKTVCVQKYNSFSDNIEDTAIGVLRLNNNIAIGFEVSWTLHSNEDSIFLSVFGKNGTIEINPFKFLRKKEFTDNQYESQVINYNNQYMKSYENELKHFISAVNGDLEMTSTVNESLSRMKILESMYKSAELKKEIIMG